MKNIFVKQGYHSSSINEHLERISLLNRVDLITEKYTRQKSDRIPYVITLQTHHVESTWCVCREPIPTK